MSRTEIVETVTGRSMAELRAARDRASGDIVELRLDGVADPDVGAALAGRTRPVLVTCRPVRDGGRFDGDEDTRLALLAEAVRQGAEFVDIEWHAGRDRLPASDRTRVVVSSHHGDGVPRDPGGLVREMAATGADIVKVVVTPSRLGDCLALVDQVRLDRPHVVLGMGRYGLLTRLCPWIWGSCWTFAGDAASEGVSVSDLRDRYRVNGGSPATTVYGVAGEPLAHSASPAMHNTALRAAGLDAIYVPFETGDADELLRVAEALGARGLSVTAPLKASTAAHVRTADDISRQVGVINSLRRGRDGWEGANFDVAGFLAPLERRGASDLRGRRAVILGSGGAARMAVWALQSRGAEVEISARRADRAAAIAGALGATVGSWPPAPDWDLLVNATPVGTWPHVEASPIDEADVRGRCVYDLVYNPQVTRLMRSAQQAGIEAIGGLEMLVGQACLQFEWWTGTPAPRELMAEAAARFVAEAQATA